MSDAGNEDLADRRCGWPGPAADGLLDLALRCRSAEEGPSHEDHDQMLRFGLVLSHGG